MTTAVPVDHWRQFKEFALYELAAGGPDPHMRYAGKAAFPYGWDEIIWRAGVYIAFYNFPTAEVVWQHWPYKDAATYDGGVEAWLLEHWQGLKTRRERRTVRTPEKMAACLTGYLEWMKRLPAVLKELPADPEDAYEALWEEAEDIPYFGRYATFKLLEFYRRYADVNIRMPDIRPEGGYSPRLTMAMFGGFRLDPRSGGEWLSREEAYVNRPEALGRVDVAASLVLRRMQMELNLPIDYYLVEVFLCDYRQSWEGQRQYPGRSNDSELGYYEAIKPYWGDRYTSELPFLRGNLTPALCRGELGGWKGVREVLGTVLHEHGYTWSDLLYDYTNTLSFGNPEERRTVSLEGIYDLAKRALPKV
jgi:hypothetical protein